jgi:ParB-like nuclease domain
MARETGFSSLDAQSDFSRARRRRALARLSARLRREPDDVDVILPFEEVVAALGRAGERRLGLQSISLDSIVGTVDRSREFDRSFRPTSGRVRKRWERIAKAMRKGEAMPPITVYRVGDMHFVEDGHHRVSVARELGLETIDAYVTEIRTAVGADTGFSLRDLALKSHERLFFERVPLPAEARSRIQLPNKSRYADFAEAIEAWGFRAMQAQRRFMTREEVAEAWFRDEYVPVVEMLREADLIGRNITEAEAYEAVSALRYLLLRTHEWDERTLERLQEELSRPASREEDTAVRRLRREIGR